MVVLFLCFFWETSISVLQSGCSVITYRTQEFPLLCILINSSFWFFLNIITLTDIIVSHCGFIISDAKHIFTYLLTIECLFLQNKNFVVFLTEWLGVLYFVWLAGCFNLILLFNCRNSFYILDTNPLSDKCLQMPGPSKKLNPEPFALIVHTS